VLVRLLLHAVFCVVCHQYSIGRSGVVSIT
jgi:hypothetical protein